MSEEGEVEKNATKERDTSSVSRRGVMKALGAAGGAGIAGGFAAPVGASSSAESSAEIDRITGKELGRLVREVASHDDVRNVIGPVMRKTVRGGRLVEVKHGGQPQTIITRSSRQVAKENGLNDLAEEDVIVAAARHTFGNGNEMIAAAYFSGDGTAIAYYGYDRPVGGVKDKAELWDVDESGEDPIVSLEDASYNGSPIRLVSGMDSQMSTTEEDPCGGCHCRGPGDPNPGEELKNVCRGGSALSCALGTASCAGCVMCSGTGACLVCVFTSCPAALLACCGGREEACVRCACFS